MASLGGAGKSVAMVVSAGELGGATATLLAGAGSLLTAWMYSRGLPLSVMAGSFAATTAFISAWFRTLTHTGPLLIEPVASCSSVRLGEPFLQVVGVHYRDDLHIGVQSPEERLSERDHVGWIRHVEHDEPGPPPPKMPKYIASGFQRSAAAWKSLPMLPSVTPWLPDSTGSVMPGQSPASLLSPLVLASSSRTQVPVPTTSAVAGVACGGPSVDVR
jgi:hypothetical protein